MFRNALFLVLVAMACTPEAPKQEVATRSGLPQSVEIEDPADLVTYLQKQPPGSADTMILDAMPPPVIVKVSVQHQAARGFDTTFTLQDGTSFTKRWTPASENTSGRYVAIFGLAARPKSVSTITSP